MGNNVTAILRSSSDPKRKEHRIIIEAPWFVMENEVHDYLTISHINEDIQRVSTDYKSRVNTQVNHLAMNLLDNNRDVKTTKKAPCLRPE